MVEILARLPEFWRERAGVIYYEAFRRKLQPALGHPEQVRRLLSAGFNLDFMMGAMATGELLGIAGFQSQAGVFTLVGWRNSLRALGWLRGPFAWLVLNWFARETTPAEHLRIAALAVTAEARGQGIGSALLEAVCDKARREGYRAVRLEVVDTNTNARRLYERVGFEVIATHRYPLPPGWLGFSGEAVMVKPV